MRDGSDPHALPSPSGLSPSTRRALLAIGATILATAAILLAMGRTPWCACGSAVPWAWDVWTRHNSQHAIDPYWFTHVLHGLAFYGGLWLVARRVAVAWRGVIAIVLESAWEVLENTDAIIERYRAVTMSLDYFGDSVVNSAFDILACALGFWIAARLRPRWSVALFVAVELVLLFWVRDGLLINIIMLLYPIDALKQWQTPPGVAP